jgi:hypothetical protein
MNVADVYEGQSKIINPNTPGRTRTCDPRFRKPMPDIDKVVDNKELTKNEQNDFAIYLANSIRNEPDLQAVIEAWPGLPDKVKKQIKRLADNKNRTCQD